MLNSITETHANIVYVSVVGGGEKKEMGQKEECTLSNPTPPHHTSPPHLQTPPPRLRVSLLLPLSRGGFLDAAHTANGRGQGVVSLGQSIHLGRSAGADGWKSAEAVAMTVLRRHCGATGFLAVTACLRLCLLFRLLLVLLIPENVHFEARWQRNHTRLRPVWSQYQHTCYRLCVCLVLTLTLALY